MDRDEIQQNSNQENNNSNNVKQNLVHKGGQAAATYLGGAAGKQMYDAASNTELGQKIEKAAANKISTLGSNHENNLPTNMASTGLEDERDGLKDKIMVLNHPKMTKMVLKIVRCLEINKKKVERKHLIKKIV